MSLGSPEGGRASTTRVEVISPSPEEEVLSEEETARKDLSPARRTVVAGAVEVDGAPLEPEIPPPRGLQFNRLIMPPRRGSEGRRGVGGGAPYSFDTELLGKKGVSSASRGDGRLVPTKLYSLGPIVLSIRRRLDRW